MIAFTPLLRFYKVSFIYRCSDTLRQCIVLQRFWIHIRIMLSVHNKTSGWEFWWYVPTVFLAQVVLFQALGCVLFYLCYHVHPFEDSAKLRILNVAYTVPSGCEECRDILPIIGKFFFPYLDMSLLFFYGQFSIDSPRRCCIKKELQAFLRSWYFY